MHEVIPEFLWTGNSQEARDVSTLLAHGVAAIVDLAHESLPPTLPRDMVYCRFPIVDGSDNSEITLRAAVATTARFIGEMVPTFVCCGAGMSRAPAIVAAALAEANDRDPDDCLRQVGREGPHDVSPALWDEIKSAIGRHA